MAYLGLLVDDVVVNKFEISEGALTIGRAPDNQVQIEDHAVSSYHAQILCESDPYLENQHTYSIEDLKSTNATRVNGIKITQQKLNHGDLIEIGYNKFRFVDKSQTKLDRTAVILPE